MALPSRPEKKTVKDRSVPHSSELESSVASDVLSRARQGDQAAFQRITMLYVGLVYHWCRKAGLTPEDSEDVGQAVFLSVSRHLEGFRRDKPGDSFRGWLRTITRSKIADFYRDRAPREVSLGSEPDQWVATADSESHDEPMGEHDSETMILYDRAIALLHGEFAEKDCQAFRMVVMEGASAQEAASTIGISVNSVYIAKSRMLKRLRDEFAELMDGDSL